MPMAPTNAYQQNSKLAISPRGAEAEAFSKATRRLYQASTGEFEYKEYASALQFNRKLWTVIQADLAQGGMHLTPELRQNILDLSLFVDNHTNMALTDPNAAHLTTLIEINRKIVKGLVSASPRPEG